MAIDEGKQVNGPHPEQRETAVAVSRLHATGKSSLRSPEASARIVQEVKKWLLQPAPLRKYKTMTALAKHLGVTHQYVSKVSQQFHQRFLYDPEIQRARLQAKLVELAIYEGDTKAARMWLEMQKEDHFRQKTNKQAEGYEHVDRSRPTRGRWRKLAAPAGSEEVEDRLERAIHRLDERREQLGEKQESTEVSKEAITVEETEGDELQNATQSLLQPDCNASCLPIGSLPSDPYVAKTRHADKENAHNVVQQQESDEQKIAQAAAYAATYDDEARGLAHAVQMLRCGRPGCVTEDVMGKLRIALQQCRTERAQRREEYLMEVLGREEYLKVLSQR